MGKRTLGQNKHRAVKRAGKTKKINVKIVKGKTSRSSNNYQDYDDCGNSKDFWLGLGVMLIPFIFIYFLLFV